MTQERSRHLPVIDDGKVVGMISIGDVVKQRLDDAELEVESLCGYVARRHDSSILVAERIKP
jgi:signal-transduction protein with cAMP-binding, CBS, and nucleotidyltransferase domain